MVESSAEIPLFIESGIPDGGIASFQALVCKDSALVSSGLDPVSLSARLPLIVLTSSADVRQAVQAMKLGATDYLVYPLQRDELVAAVERAVEINRLGAARSVPHKGSANYPMLGQSEVMMALFRDIRDIGPTEGPVLITGEPGTGKELVAHALHAASQRQQTAMISVNCASIPAQLIESVIFGQDESLQPTGNNGRNGLLQAADGGTLFLDEIGALPLEAQARLLNVLQSGKYRGIGSTTTHSINVRLIAAGHHNLGDLSNIGRFRKDLLYHLGETTLNLAPLRERSEDIPLLAEHLLERTCYRLNRPPCGFSSAAMEAMKQYHWPGNVRELENAIERAVILNTEGKISASLLAIDTTRTEKSMTDSAATGRSALSSLEDYFVQFVLEHQEELTETELAQQLGISRKSLWERRQRLDIPRKKTRKKAPRRNQNHMS